MHGKFVSFEDDLITNQIETFGAHTRNEIAMLIKQIQPGAICVDIGAHIGAFTVPLANHVGAFGRILAIEGSPENFSLLVQNVQLNKLEGRVTCVQAIADYGAQRSLARHELPGNSGGGYYMPIGQSAP